MKFYYFVNEVSAHIVTKNREFISRIKIKYTVNKVEQCPYLYVMGVFCFCFVWFVFFTHAFIEHHLRSLRRGCFCCHTIKKKNKEKENMNTYIPYAVDAFINYSTLKKKTRLFQRLE